MGKRKKKAEIAQLERRRERLETTRYEPNYQEGLTSDQVQEHRLHG